MIGGTRIKFGLPPLTRSLSARLLVLTVVFVLVGEVLIYVPSVARFRLVYLEEHIAAARIAALAVEAAPGQMVTEELGDMLLHHAGVVAISLKRPGRRTLILSSDMPPAIDKTFDMRAATPPRLIRDALDSILHGEGRAIRVMGVAPKDDGETIVDIVMREQPMRDAMLDYSTRILVLSIVLALITAGLVFLSLHLFLVRPMRRMTDSLVAFRRDPEDAHTVVAVTRRRDEIGLAQRELQVMQRRVRAALRQKARLAAVGGAVNKINHDLRNMLATAALMTDRLALTGNPDVQRLASPLVDAIDRAIKLCTQTLSYAKSGEPEPVRSRFALRRLADEVASALQLPESEAMAWRNDVPEALLLHADRDQSYRVLMNLIGNAVEAVGAPGRVGIKAWREGAGTVVEIADNGPGLSAQARDHLFEAFAASSRAGGTGLGLAIARDLVRGHGGQIRLHKSDSEGTVFHLYYPDITEA